MSCLISGGCIVGFGVARRRRRRLGYHNLRIGSGKLNQHTRDGSRIGGGECGQEMRGIVHHKLQSIRQIPSGGNARGIANGQGTEIDTQKVAV